MVAGLDTTHRVELEDSPGGRARTVQPAGAWWLQRLAPARLTSRIILINFVGLVILVGGILYSNQSRQSLIDARVQSLMTQGHIMAAAIASAASVDTHQIIIDPDKLLDLQQKLVAAFPATPEYQRDLATTSARTSSNGVLVAPTHSGIEPFGENVTNSRPGSGTLCGMRIAAQYGCYSIPRRPPRSRAYCPRAS